MSQLNDLSVAEAKDGKPYHSPKFVALGPLQDFVLKATKTVDFGVSHTGTAS